MRMGPWWKNAFEKGVYPLALVADEPQRRRRTPREVSFLRRALRLPRGARLLDLGCGIGRYAIPLSRQGYAVTGADISRMYLAEARRRAREARTSLRLVRRDMRRLGFQSEFEGVLNLFTSFGYFPDSREDLGVLRGIYRALVPGGRLLLDTINGARVMRQFVPNRWSEMWDGSLVLEGSRLFKRQRAVQTRWIFISNGTRKEMVSFVRLYNRSRMAAALRRVGLRVLRFWGGLDGSRYVPNRSMRLVVLAQRPL